jgi:hypothetical protein
MVRLEKKYQLLYNGQTKEIANVIVDGITEINENIFSYFESEDISEIESFIVENGLVKITENPFDTAWDASYPDAKLRLFMYAIDSARLSIDKPEFVMYLKMNNINLLVDEGNGGVWAYLQYIEPEHKAFLEKLYEAKFESK